MKGCGESFSKHMPPSLVVKSSLLGADSRSPTRDFYFNLYKFLNKSFSLKHNAYTCIRASTEIRKGVHFGRHNVNENCTSLSDWQRNKFGAYKTLHRQVPPLPALYQCWIINAVTSEYFLKLLMFWRHNLNKCTGRTCLVKSISFIGML